MLPIYIFSGLDRYMLVRASSPHSSSNSAVERVEPARVRFVLESALRHPSPALLRALADALSLRDEDTETIVARALAEVSRAGLIAGEFVLMRVIPVELAARPPEEQPELPKEEEPAEEPEEEPEEEAPPEARTTIRVSLFFDGTANNRSNTLARLRNTQAWKDNQGEGSFQNDLTNVSRLETLLIGDDAFEHSFSIYVEGIGTTDGEGDSLWGMGTGLGGTGVVAKVDSGIRELLSGVRELGLAGGEIIERFHVDAFGFSRGAAAARHFVHKALTGDPLEPQIEGLGHTVEEFKVNFVGLFDTVASYGVVHSNDTRDLDLDAVRSASRVVQLAAAEEHRKNFRLTDITSAVGAGVGTELYLPGVHSDIGGGYTDHYAEVELQILDIDVLFTTKAVRQRFARERQWLIGSGWYRADEIAEVNWWNELKVTKRGIRNHYNRIPLKHMANFAANTGLDFEPVAVHHPVPAALASIDALVDAHVAAHTGGGSTANHWINNMTPDMRRLRHDYLHFSAYFGNLANGPQFIPSDPMIGRRQRIVQRG